MFLFYLYLGMVLHLIYYAGITAWHSMAPLREPWGRFVLWECGGSDL